MDPIPDNNSSKMSLWAKASSVLNPLKAKNEKEDMKVDEKDKISEVPESKLGSSSKTSDEK